MSRTTRPRRVVDVAALVSGIVAAVVFVVCIVTVVVAQQTTGWLNLLFMIVALAVLIGMLALYNRRYR